MPLPNEFVAEEMNVTQCGHKTAEWPNFERLYELGALAHRTNSFTHRVLRCEHPFKNSDTLRWTPNNLLIKDM